jgi:hypothetical protein
MTVLDASDLSVQAHDRGANSAWQEEARAWLSQPPGECAAKGAARNGECNDKSGLKAETPETFEVKAAYKAMLEKTRGLDASTVADSLNLFGDLASASANTARLSDSLTKNRSADKRTADQQMLEPRVSTAYTSLLQRGLKPVVIIDVLNIAGDVAAIATSPQGRKLFEDMKTLVSHLKG